MESEEGGLVHKGLLNTGPDSEQLLVVTKDTGKARKTFLKRKTVHRFRNVKVYMRRDEEDTWFPVGHGDVIIKYERRW